MARLLLNPGVLRRTIDRHPAPEGRGGVIRQTLDRINDGDRQQERRSDSETRGRITPGDQSRDDRFGYEARTKSAQQ